MKPDARSRFRESNMPTLQGWLGHGPVLPGSTLDPSEGSTLKEQGSPSNANYFQRFKMRKHRMDRHGQMASAMMQYSLCHPNTSG